MAKKPKRRYWLIDRKHLEEVAEIQGLDSVMDMLRYDGARVECNPPEGFYLLSSEHEGNVPTIARWNSFGIQIAALCAEYDAHDVARIVRTTPGHHVHADHRHYRIPHSECRKMAAAKS